MTRNHAAMFVLITTVTLSACGDDWGSKIEAFVDNEVHGLTAGIAENELRVRWFDYFSGLATKSILVIDAANKLTNADAIAVAPIDTFEQREKMLELIETSAINNIQTEKMLRDSEAELSNSSSICETAVASMHRVDVASLGSRIASNIALPKSEWYLEISCQFGGGNGQDSGSNEKKSGDSNGCWKSLVSLVSTILGTNKQREQEAKASAAIARVPGKVVSPAEIESMSKSICKQNSGNPTLIGNIEKARSALQVARQNVRDVAKTLDGLRISINAAQMPILLQQVRDSSGIERVANEISKEYESLFVLQAIDLQRKDIATFEKRFNLALSCGDVLAAAELYSRVLAEKRKQLEAAVKIESEYAAQFNSLLAVVKSAEGALPNQRAIRLTKVCAMQ